jgi:hypothetical protein
MRERYVMSEDEIKIMLQGLKAYGPDETYKRIQERTFSSMINTDSIDDMIMDMYETMLKEARKCEDGKELKLDLYQLASMLRFSAHDANRFLSSHGKASKSSRFLKIASYNEDIPIRTWRP